MTALTANRNTPNREGYSFEYPVAASVCCYAGALAVLDSSGNVKPGVTATGLIPVGRFEALADNSSGGAGAIKVKVLSGIFRWNNSSATDEITKAEIGDRAFIVDDQTVAKLDGSNTRSLAGQVVDVDDYGVWVRTGMEVQTISGLLAANNLSDLGSAATARGNLGGGTNKVIVPMGAVGLVGSEAKVLRCVAPVAGDIKYIRTVLNGALTTGNATLTGKINGSDITNGVVTITQSASAAGDVDLATPSAAKTVAVGNVISLTVGGSNDASVTADCLIEITPSA